MENPTVKVTVEVTPVQVEQVAPQITQPTNNVGNSLVGKVLVFHITRPPVMLAENEVVTLSDDPDAYTLVHNPRYDIAVPEEYQGCLVFNMLTTSTFILTDKIEIANFTDEEKDPTTYAINATRKYVILSNRIDEINSIGVDCSMGLVPEHLFNRMVVPMITDITFTGVLYNHSDYIGGNAYFIKKEDVKILNGSDEVIFTNRNFGLCDKFGNLLSSETFDNVDYWRIYYNGSNSLSLGVGLQYRPFFTKEFTVSDKIHINTYN